MIWAFLYSIPIFTTRALFWYSGRPYLELGIELSCGLAFVVGALAYNWRAHNRKGSTTRHHPLSRPTLIYCTVLLMIGAAVEYYFFPWSKIKENPFPIFGTARTVAGMLPILAGELIWTRLLAPRLATEPST